MLNGNMKREVLVSDNPGVAKFSRHHLEMFTI